MKKRNDDPITAKDLEQFVYEASDFAFEMRVVKQLRDAGFVCSHSGTYRDPVTAKARQFDMRAHRHVGNSTLALAVERKNLRTNNPLLVNAVERTEAESFHDLIVCHQERHSWYEIRQCIGTDSAYKREEMVAKRMDQVNKDLISNDEKTFDKLNQAVNSCQDLVSEFSTKSSAPFQRAIVPVLVVPTDVLWQVDYGPDGVVVAPPRQVSRSALFVDHAWPLPEYGYPKSHSHYRLSHIEIVTLNALPQAIDSWFTTFFPPDPSPR